MDHIKLGYAPTRRSIFSAPDAVKYRGLTADRLRELGVDFVDITDINEEGLLYNDEDMKKIAEKFKAEKIDGLFLPHCNFGTEYECARLAKELNVPVLLWGPLDERPDENGVRLRDIKIRQDNRIIQGIRFACQRIDRVCQNHRIRFQDSDHLQLHTCSIHISVQPVPDIKTAAIRTSHQNRDYFLIPGIVKIFLLQQPALFSLKLKMLHCRQICPTYLYFIPCRNFLNV